MSDPVKVTVTGSAPLGKERLNASVPDNVPDGRAAQMRMLPCRVSQPSK